ncbi:MAG TPA: hypothetical protein VJO15_09625 [Dehalococcoidia bacterium]|nr:hypothetical protein [Dehalococcoidia bacterium]
MSRLKVLLVVAVVIGIIGSMAGAGPAPAFADPGSNPTGSDSHGEHITMAVEHHESVAQAAEDHDSSVRDFQSHVDAH